MTTTAKTILDLGNSLEHARAWNETSEKWTFCTDLLDAHDVDRSYVDLLELGFSETLKLHGIEDLDR